MQNRDNMSWIQIYRDFHYRWWLVQLCLMLKCFSMYLSQLHLSHEEIYILTQKLKNISETKTLKIVKIFLKFSDI